MKNLLAPLFIVGLAAQAQAVVSSNDPANANYSNPYNLDIAAPAQVAGSDAKAADFQANVLPGLLSFVQANLAEKSTLTNLSAISLDPSNLTLNSDAALRVYFLGEGAGYRNQLGFSTTGTSTQTGTPLAPDAALIFPNASSPVGYGGNNVAIRSGSEPLLPGDFVDLGTYSAGTSLDFFLISNGASGGTNYFTTEGANNRDGVVHAVSLAPNGSAYLVIGFEDMYGGGDKDYNDLVFAVEIGKVNVAKLTGIGAPEPSLAAGALLALAGTALIRRRKH
jgi:hypothetical protein